MSLRKLILFSMVAVFCLDRSAFSQVNGVEIAGGETAQVFGGKEPVVKVIDVEGKEVASIPIEKDPGKFIYSKSANTLYVVHDEKKGEHFISAVNLTTNRVDGLRAAMSANPCLDKPALALADSALTTQQCREGRQPQQQGRRQHAVS